MRDRELPYHREHRRVVGWVIDPLHVPQHEEDEGLQRNAHVVEGARDEDPKEVLHQAACEEEGCEEEGCEEEGCEEEGCEEDGCVGVRWRCEVEVWVGKVPVEAREQSGQLG